MTNEQRLDGIAACNRAMIAGLLAHFSHDDVAAYCTKIRRDHRNGKTKESDLALIASTLLMGAFSGVLEVNR